MQAYEEALKRLEMEQANRQDVVPELRKQSRYDYLKKRRADKLEDLEAEIAEEEYYFADSNLTDKEKRDLEYKRKVRDLAREHERAGQREKVDRSVRHNFVY